ncbi:MAG: type II toxin-antitoxin system VapC family toxin [Alphaproteobacteria bacterium]|nr:type II toxin-antitoxin system VapC family toxin [Alphaproteobacteria bacterium]
MTFVVDASVSLAWCFEDEKADVTERLLRRCAIEGATVPGIWTYEMVNGLRAGVLRGRISGDQAVSCWRLLTSLPITVIDIDPLDGEEIWRLALHLGLTGYDASYLCLCQWSELPLATTDRGMRTAAASMKIDALG